MAITPVSAKPAQAVKPEEVQNVTETQEESNQTEVTQTSAVVDQVTETDSVEFSIEAQVAGGEESFAPEQTDTETVINNEAKVEEVPVSKPSQIVQSGDSLSKIAAEHGLTWQEVYEANKDLIGDDPNLIKPGQELVIPGAVEAEPTSTIDSEAQVAGGEEAAVEQADTETEVSDETEGDLPTGSHEEFVANYDLTMDEVLDEDELLIAGAGLGAIQESGLELTEQQEFEGTLINTFLNGGPEGNGLYPDYNLDGVISQDEIDRLASEDGVEGIGADDFDIAFGLSEEIADEAPDEEQPAPVTQIVEPGDSLSKIASQHGITWQEIYEVNQDTIGDNPDLIHPGQELIIPNAGEVEVQDTIIDGAESGSSSEEVEFTLTDQEFQAAIDDVEAQFPPIDLSEIDEANLQDFVEGETGINDSSNESSAPSATQQAQFILSTGGVPNIVNENRILIHRGGELDGVFNLVDGSWVYTAWMQEETPEQEEFIFDFPS